MGTWNDSEETWSANIPSASSGGDQNVPSRSTDNVSREGVE